MQRLIYQFIFGLVAGIVPFGLIDLISQHIPYLKEKFYGNPSDIPTLVFGYHVHHSVLGLVSIIWSTWCYVHKTNSPSFWMGFGMGIIVAHTLLDGRLVFIEKIKS